MVAVDLHTHSLASPDGALSAAHYRRMLAQGGMGSIAITDHNTTDFARQLHTELGSRIIVGEEIATAEGEIIGLFLRRTVPAGLSLAETVHAIRQQHGLVYVPHPFETARSGLSAAALETIAGDIDIIEAYNGRAMLQNRTAQALAWAEAHGVPAAASSDSHGWHGWGRTYTVIAEAPTADALPKLLRSARYYHRAPGVRGMLYPTMNRLRKRGERHAS